MEGLLLILVIYLICKDAVMELPFTLRGKPPPRHERRMERLRQKRGHSGQRPMPRTGVGRYFSGLVDHAASEAAHKREQRAKPRRAAREVKAAHKTVARVQKVNNRLTDKTNRRQAARDRWDAVPDSTEAQDLTSFDTMPARSEVDPDGYGRHRFPEADGPVARPSGTPVAVPRRQSEQAASEPEVATEEVAESTPEPALRAVPDPVTVTVTQLKPTSETITLDSAIAFAAHMVRSLTMTLSAIELMAATLEGKCDVDGPVMQELGKTWSALKSAKDSMEIVHTELVSRTQVRDATNAVNGKAGSQALMESTG